jgi:ABC-2 type transport system ATP-binding protein
MVTIDNLTVSYRAAGPPALANLSLHIEGSALIIGPSGAGKSTLIKAIAGLLRPTQGRIWLDGEPISRRPLAARRKVAYMPQENWLPREATLAEYLAELAILDGYPPSARQRAVRDVAELVHLKAALPMRLKWLSGGMKRRALLAQALLRRTAWLLLDEPTLGLDPEEQASVRSLIRHIAQHRRVIVATQFVEDANAVPDRLLILRQGRLAADTSWDALMAVANGRLTRVPWSSAVTQKGRLWAPEAGGKTVILYERGLRHPTAAPEQVAPTPEDGYLLLMHDREG